VVEHGQEIIPKELLDLYPNLIIVVSGDGKVVEVNKHAGVLLKLGEERLLRSSLYDLCVPDVRGELKRLTEESFTRGQTASSTIALQTGDGETIDVELSLSRYPSNSRAKHAYCVVTARDVSEERKKELDLLRFSNIAHYTVNPLEITDVDGRIIYVNPAFEKASGYSREEVIGKNPNIFGSGKHPKSFWKKMWDTIKSGHVWVGEIENRRRNGEPFFTQLLISPIIDGSGKVVGYFGVHRDITEQRYLQQQLTHAQKMESIGLLAAGIAHEVGNPLTSISSLVQVIQRSTADEFTQEKLELIKSQIARISRIIRDLVDFSRRSSYEVQLTDVNKSIRQSVEIVRVGKKAKDISFRVHLDESIPQLPLVPDQMEQVFINILINAVDAIQAKVSDPLYRVLSTVRGEIVVSSSLHDGQVLITIQDNGKGIPEETLPKIFEPFFTTKKVGEGTGLGLWVSYGIIRSFQGNIEVDSGIGRGTTFTITLPLYVEFSK
jgi:PAS domain S-box-containing protein